MIRDVEIREAGAKGLGVFARRPFREGEFIFRRRYARILSRDEVASSSEQDRTRLCALGFDRFGLVAPPGCYLNHSCDPNAMRHGVTVFAWRSVATGEEITLDYRINAYEGSSWPCHCGSRTCSGTVVGSYFAMDADRQKALLPHAPSFIQREYRRRQQMPEPA